MHGIMHDIKKRNGNKTVSPRLRKEDFEVSNRLLRQQTQLVMSGIAGIKRVRDEQYESVRKAVYEQLRMNFDNFLMDSDDQLGDDELSDQ